MSEILNPTAEDEAEAAARQRAEEQETLREVENLSAADRARLMEETVAAGKAVRVLGGLSGFEVGKLNIGALGNVTAQLHVHVVGRQVGDPAWPGPVWGHSAAEAHEDASDAVLVARKALGL